MWKIEGIKFTPYEEINLNRKIAELLKIKEKDILHYEIIKKSVDARKKDNIFLIYSLKVKIKDNILINENLFKENHKIIWEKEEVENGEIIRKKKYSSVPVIIGTGPSGLFAAIKLVEKGYKPLVIERGKEIAERIKDVDLLWNKGIVNKESNVQFGEGGAGTFSDGKLTCRKNDSLIKYILKTFVKYGGPEEILYDHKPHIGTDNLRKIVTLIRKDLETRGAIFLFNTKLVNIGLNKNKIYKIETNKNSYETDSIILATGHSSRETYSMLFNLGVKMEPKGFAVGFRIEHAQKLIDQAQFGKFAGHPALGRADYFLKYTDCETKRGVYSFCMCPGGTIICGSSEEKGLVINGMSNYKRNSGYGNSALVVTISEKDFYRSSPLDGINFQRNIEKKAYLLGGGDYKAPAQGTISFLYGKKDEIINSTYRPSITPVNLEECYPKYIIKSIKNGLMDFRNKIKYFDNSILIGVETRTSSPVRISRDDSSRESLNISGLYPVGEGAGYAGGIISAALDGLKTAELF